MRVKYTYSKSFPQKLTTTVENFTAYSYYLSHSISLYNILFPPHLYGGCAYESNSIVTIVYHSNVVSVLDNLSTYCPH